jgi:molecular chaperone DnaK
MAQIIGIDLGTTNTVAAVWRGSRIEIIPSLFGERMTPSAVLFPEGGGNPIVGRDARRQVVLRPDRTIVGIKRFMGRAFNEVSDLALRVPYQVVPSESGEVMIEVDGKHWSPEQISGFILDDVRRAASAFLGEEVTEAVITVPAYFTHSQRAATVRAALLANLTCRRLVVEPVAAALGYGKDRIKDIKAVVVDLGGGTYDVTCVEVGDGVAQAISVDGDGQLGGDDFDAVLYEFVCREAERALGWSPRENLVAASHLRELVITAKERLSSYERATVDVPAFVSRGGSPGFCVELTREFCDSLWEELVHRLAAPIRRALANTGRYFDKADHLLFVGGATRMPSVVAAAKRLVPTGVVRAYDQDEAVAHGAAVQGGVLNGDCQDIVLLDVVPSALGVEDVDGYTVTLIPKNTTIPTQKKEIFLTGRAHRSVEVNLVQGDSARALNNLSLGRLALPVSKPGAEVEVTFDIDANGVVIVHAKDLTTGLTESLSVLQSGRRAEEVS